MSKHDWGKFSQKIYIKGNSQQVYDAWTTRANLEKWFLRKAEFIKPDGIKREDSSPVQQDDIYEWMWHGHPDTAVEHGVVTEANGKDRFQFVFGKAGVVTVRMKETGPFTEMILTQDQIPTDEHGKINYHLGCATCWTFYLANIKSVLEGGLDLRNKNLEFTGVVNS